MTRLLDAAGQRKVVYLAAYYTGLRRGELKALEWSDVHLEGDKPFLVARASTTKNGKDAPIPLHPDLAAALRELKAAGDPEAEVFAGLLPKMRPSAI